jgi:hypothetical protein
MQEHLCRTLSHYLLYIGCKLGVYVTNHRTERFLLDAARDRWEKQGLFLWLTSIDKIREESRGGFPVPLRWNWFESSQNPEDLTSENSRGVPEEALGCTLADVSIERGLEIPRNPSETWPLLEDPLGPQYIYKKLTRAPNESTYTSCFRRSMNRVPGTPIHGPLVAMEKRRMVRSISNLKILVGWRTVATSAISAMRSMPYANRWCHKTDCSYA